MLQINPLSSVNPNHLSYFQFVGRIIGLAIKHGQYLEGGFTMPLYKLLLGKQITGEDMAYVDPTFHNSLMWMLDNVRKLLCLPSLRTFFSPLGSICLPFYLPVLVR